MQHPDSILTLLKKSEEFLKKKEIPSARLDAELLLADLLGLQRVKLYVNFERLLTETEKNAYRERIVERSKNKPTAYITGQKSFYNSVFFVNEKVLIPRPETEELVEKVLNDLKENSETIEVLDLCSGSGCIGISLKLAKKNWNVLLSDISEDALSVARENASKILGKELAVEFLQSDLLTSFPPQSKFDLIVTNPPYIPVSDKPEMMKDVVDYEPHLALFRENPETFSIELISQCYERLIDGGRLYMETLPSISESLVSKSLKEGWKEGTVGKDLSGKERFVVLTK
ncbi:peptide chain release factor N(5)-glutamine methyltransferase [Leptospira gomenensis]|uniref:Release factor glutamine methyltransferase n=1 Tax=Leptospira gomenensis TaxID=2484974 RepID=A0A5F1YM63_9LEPT|nr:peptide chain release factor N(5)-glutamine methyltransferase [Leptospira gomenensis]TGK32685.1 peptide chain release factor N(5)-glutamine methyltransferase [Leptospira gomenensis]TGK36833.1 peptide chain release factor N(5)-glutamine methyltransferase [Leptospira gomenensis]TGK39908.1 peptide chain release factor N(5)-glutamine methyltransferase [Leptospira gomenensis]TGK58043.1 peptide chain release factor N(5)-glutamine methyltransferase [Leptospira gomenensis]